MDELNVLLNLASFVFHKYRLLKEVQVDKYLVSHTSSIREALLEEYKEKHGFQFTI